jgi:hypothetical protein
MQIKSDKTYDFIKNYLNEDVYTDYLNNKMQENIKIDVLKYNVLDFVNNGSTYPLNAFAFATVVLIRL